MHKNNCHEAEAMLTNNYDTKFPQISKYLYQNCLSLHPVKTQAISSAILWGVGDLSAHYITHSAAQKRLQLSDSDASYTINWNFWAVASMFGFGFVGPVGHF